MTDRYDLLLLKARSEMIGKTILRKGVDSDTVFNSVWDDVIKGPRDFKQGADETLNAPQGGPRAWLKRRKQIKGLSPEGRKGWDELLAGQKTERQGQRAERRQVKQDQKANRKAERARPPPPTGEEFAQKHGGLIQDVQAPKPTPNVKAMAADMAKPRDNSRLRDMARSVQATPPSLPTDNTTAGQLGGRSEKLSAELKGLKGGASLPKQTATPPSVDPNRKKISDLYNSNTQRMTVPEAQAKRDKALAGLKQKDIEGKVDKWPTPPAPAPAVESSSEPSAYKLNDAASKGEATLEQQALAGSGKIEELEATMPDDPSKITNWVGKISPDDDVSLLPFGLIKDTKPPQEGASDYSLLPGGWAEGGAS